MSIVNWNLRFENGALGFVIMGRRKHKRTAAEKAAKRRLRLETMIIFINGKQKRVKRPATIEGMDVDEFIRQNADPIWLHQNEMWEYMEVEPPIAGPSEPEFPTIEYDGRAEDDEDLPF
jgi:hypothetical protein